MFSLRDMTAKGENPVASLAYFENMTAVQPGEKHRTLQRFVLLNGSRTRREKSGQFAMEGFRLVLDALESGVRLSALILTQRAAAQYGDAFAPFLKSSNPLLIADAVAKEISDTETAQGVFAIGIMPQAQLLVPQKGHRSMLLHNVQDPSNLGAIMRTAEALGTDGLYLYHCCDAYNPKAIRSSMGALFRIPYAMIDDLDSFVADCHGQHLPLCAAVVDRDVVSLKAFDCTGGAVVCIGNEGNGLPLDFSDACDVKLTIPMSPASNSLNAAMAAGLFLWEMSRYL